MSFAIFRVAKLYRGRGAGSLSRSWRHLEEHGHSAEISHPERSKHNSTVVNPYVERKGLTEATRAVVEAHKKASGRALRKDASIAAEMIFTFSPRSYDEQYNALFRVAVLNYIKSEFPQFQLWRLDAHADEKTYHIHAIGVFRDEQKKICTKIGLGGPAEMRQHQDKFAEAVKHLGLARGISKKVTKAKHKTKGEWLRLKEIEAEAKKALEDIFSER